MDLMMTQYGLSEITRRLAADSWSVYLGGMIRRE